MEYINNSIDDILFRISLFKRDRIEDILSFLYEKEEVQGVLLGGSITYKEEISRSDFDFFCLVSNISKFKKVYIEAIYELDFVDTIVNQGFFPWTEELYTIYYVHNLDFSVDLCLIDETKVSSFFWEPTGVILFDKMNKIKVEKQNKVQFVQPFLKENPFSLSVITIKKIEKNLSRNHLWNALFLLGTLRRYIMQIIRLDLINHREFLGRVDRDFEDFVPTEFNAKLARTVARYNVKNIAENTICLIGLLCELNSILKKSNMESNMEPWVSKQLEHEKNKLLNYID